ncbi:nuclear transport factor 2 family protein [Mycobacterium sp. CVI_P3]|uniref:Nuclear transport factor 2 family protein n=1 Tax=Mycobacterium pinniadriaticum TaxID=2994102 RepID=A0ABT3SHF3_9MYCO|nr:nuclear transport factor 2 family protein [Mycobacterium pinniadriaticum]MCX2932150.1 nuclear transport factor 2 family protein [Mycobacterium pinniadriaticum]MCX2938574.1 nuclear transport factor 2 family protein [Mycobacterium pinniadriaticum]
MFTHDQILDVADRLFATITAGNVAAVAALWSDDITVWHQGEERDNDKARALKVIRWYIGATSYRHYEVLDRQVFDGGFVQQHILHSTTGRGENVALRVCLVVKIGDDGLIRRIDEYLDPAELAPLLP